MELIPYAPHRRALELQRDSEALLLLIPEADGRGRGVLSGKVFEYLAAERPILAVVPPDGAAAELIRETGAGVVVAPDDIDGIERELRAMRDRWRAGELEPRRRSTPEWRTRLDRRTRVAGARRPASQRRCEAVPADMRRVASFFFLATLFCCTFEKVHWSFGGAARARRRPRALLHRRFVVVSRPRLPRTSAVLLGVLRRCSCSSTCSASTTSTRRRARAVREGLRQVRDPLHRSSRSRSPGSARRGIAYYWRALAWFFGGIAVERGLRRPAARDGAGRREPRLALVSPLTGGASQINIYGAVNGSDVYRPNALTGDPNHLGIMLIVPLLVLTPLYLRLEPEHRLKRKLGALIAFLLVVEIATLSRSGLLGLGVGALVLLAALPRATCARARCISPIAGALARGRGRRRRRLHYFLVVIKSRVQTGRGSQSAHFQVYELHPADPPQPPAARARPEQLLDLLPGRDRQDELGPALLLRLADRRDRARRHRALRASSCSGCSCGCSSRARSATRSRRLGDPLAAACARSRGAGRPRSPGRWPRTPST